MNKLFLYFLDAVKDMTKIKQEIIPGFASAIGCKTEEIFYLWIEKRIEQSGAFAAWDYFFHGLECDLIHQNDSRFLKIEFGPGGRADTFTGWGVLQYIMASRHPWSEYKMLKKRLSAKRPPYDHFSGSYNRMVRIVKKLEKMNYIESPDIALCEIVEQNTFTDENGFTSVELPDTFSERQKADSMVCSRFIISSKGTEALKTLR